MSFKVIRDGLLAGASAMALVAGVATAPAQAFDKVYWGWKAFVHEHVDVDASIDFNLDPSGMVMLEDLQFFIGDVEAKSYVYDIDNIKPGSWNGGWDLRSWGSYKHDGHNALTQLPEVISAATAVANNTSIETDTSVQLHEGQFAIGYPEYFAILGSTISVESGGYHWGGNSNLNTAAALGALALFGGVASTDIEAKSKVWDIKNATVDSSATAIANNLTVDVAAVGEDRVLIGDVVQFAVADVDAKSKVYDVYLSNYKNLGGNFRPIVSSVATAVGNNKSISVRAPVVAAPQ